MSNLFTAAKPIWPEDWEHEKNQTFGFKALIGRKGEKILFRVAASSMYRFFINGEFIGMGPARGPHDYYRVDEWDIADSLEKEINILAVEVVSYNINSFYLIDQPPFFQGEIIIDGKVVLATGQCEGFECGILNDRVKKTQRYSFQRTFSECYRIGPDFDDWHKDLSTGLPPAKVSVTGEKKLISRNLPQFTFPLFPVKSVMETGTAQGGCLPKRNYSDRSLKSISDKIKGYHEDELEVHLTDEALAIETKVKQSGGKLPVRLSGDTYALFDFGINKTGFIGLDIECAEDTEVFLMFDEVLIDGDVNFIRLNCCNIIKYSLKCGKYNLLSFEPYTMKYIKIIALGGACVVRKVFLRENICPVLITTAYNGGGTLRKIYEAAVETFRQNCTDIYMDCPSRERAGWLCDSFFTARVEYVLTGNSFIERNFLENYLLPEKFEFLPDGMLPMCYPADHNQGTFIPNWALWLILEFYEYLDRSGDRALVDAFRDKIYKLFDYFSPFINEHGLLEGLESWVFLEWSKANELTQDVNFPTNMLYAAALDAVGRLYSDEKLLIQAKILRNTIREMSFDGEFFVDNAVRQNGNLILSGERSETCQYYAFFFDIAMPSTHHKLWETLVEVFGPNRKETKRYPEIYPSNAFIGNYLRLDLLSRYDLRERVLKEVEGYFLYMADKTGTLWKTLQTMQVAITDSLHMWHACY